MGVTLDTLKHLRLHFHMDLENKLHNNWVLTFAYKSDLLVEHQDFAI